MKPRICFDLDGVVHGYTDGYQDGTLYDDPMPGSKELIDRLKENYEIVIFTSRLKSELKGYYSSTDFNSVKEWLDKHNIYYDHITNHKVPAIAYIDDRAIEFRGDWNYVEKRIEELDSSTKKEFEINDWSDIESPKKRLDELYEMKNG